MVKGNQPGLQKKVATLLACPDLFCLAQESATTCDTNRRGRVEERKVTLAWCVSKSVDLSRYTGFCGVRAVFHVERRVLVKKTGEITSEESVLGITSLCPKAYGASSLLSLLRGHWSIENKSHYVRDVTFLEDKSPVRCGNLPPVLAAFRNAAIALMRVLGHVNIAAACRFYAAKPKQAIRAVIGNRTE